MENNIINIPYWNRKDLTPPAMISRTLTTAQPAKTSMKLRKILKKIVSTLEEMSNIGVDAALLSRLIYRMKRVFRHDKILQGMQKINRCLSNFLELNVLATMKELDICTYESNGPTKEMLQWAMLSLQRLTALVHVLINRCTSTVPAIKGKLECGHHWKIVTIVLGVIARIWAYSSFIIRKSCLWYKKLNNFLGKALETSECSLLSVHNFPQDLSLWLGNPSYLYKDSIKQPIMEEESQETMIEEEEEERSEFESPEREEVSSAMEFNEDVGEVISRTDEPLVETKKMEKKVISEEEYMSKTKRKRKSKPIPRPYFNTADEILYFLKSEKLARKRNIKTASTKILKDRQWKELYGYLKRYAKKLKELGTEKLKSSKSLLNQANMKLASVFDLQ